jgi:hypothetical protein
VPAAVPALAIAMSVVAAAGAIVYSYGGLIDRPINRNDAARLVDFYERMRKSGLADAYRRECDFMDWQSERTRDAIDPSCTEPGRQRTVCCGATPLRNRCRSDCARACGTDTSLAQVTTSACRAQIDDFDLSVSERRCEKANQYAIEAIARLRPDTVVIAQSDRHAQTDWPRLAARVRALGAGRVIVVGPFPIWRPSLPRVYAANHLTDSRRLCRHRS